MVTLAEMLRLNQPSGAKKTEKPTAPAGTSKEDLETAIKEFDQNKSARSLKALLTLAADYTEEEE